MEQMKERKEEELKKIKDLMMQFAEFDANKLGVLVDPVKHSNIYKSLEVYQKVRACFDALKCIPGDQSRWNARHNDDGEDYEGDVDF